MGITARNLLALLIAPFALFAIAALPVNAGDNPHPTHQWTSESAIPGNTQLNEVFILDQAHIWAAGDKILMFDGASWRVQLPYVGRLLNDIEAVDPNHAWAVGDCGTVFFYDGIDWRPQSCGASEDLVSVSAVDALNVWTMTIEGDIYHYNGSSWSTFASLGPSQAGYFRGLVAVDPTHIWVIYTVYENQPKVLGPFGEIFFFNGSEWQCQFSQWYVDFHSLHAQDTSHVWAGGRSGEIFFYDGSSWNQQAHLVYRTPYTKPMSITDICSFDGRYAWAIGDTGEATFVYLFDGSTWTCAYNLGYLSGISAASCTDAWAVGRDRVLHFDGRGWVEETRSPAASFPLEAISATSPMDVWAISSQYPYTALHYDGVTWHAIEIDTWGTLRDIVAVNRELVLAVGEGSIYMSSDGIQWKHITVDYWPDLHSITNDPYGRLWAVGSNGDIIYSDISAPYNWVHVDSGTGEDLYAVAALDSDSVWSVGKAGTIMFFDGKEWTAQSSGTKCDLYGIDAIDESHVWAVGAHGTALFFDGARWVRRMSGTAHDIHDVTALTPTQVWAASEEILFFDGYWWSTERADTHGFRGIFALDMEHMWAVGQGGALVQAGSAPWYSYVRQAGHDSIGVSVPDKTWYLAEGCTGPGFETWVLVQNPNDSEANITLTYMTPDGVVPGPSVVLPAGSRESFYVADTVPDTWEVSTRVTSSQPVIVERAVYHLVRAFD
ncbi:MAG: hypothetical protein V1748_01035 [Actinomycetota bacterium]